MIFGVQRRLVVVAGAAGLALIAALLLSIAVSPATAHKACGTYKSDSIYPRARVVVIRGVACGRARRVAKHFDHSGATWSAPVRVNDDATTSSQFLPYVALDSTTGTVAVGFHDCRNDNGVPGPGGTNTIPNDDAEYYGTFSTDGGATWAPNRRLSGGFSNADAANNGMDYGDYVGLDARAGKLYAMWADNANCDGTNPNGTLHQFDLYANPLMLRGELRRRRQPLRLLPLRRPQPRPLQLRRQRRHLAWATTRSLR